MTLLPVNKKVIEKYGDKWFRQKNIVSNGPFILKKWHPFYMIVLEKNPYYFRNDCPKTKKIICYIMDNATTALNYYETGKVHLLTRGMIPSDFIELVREKKRPPEFVEYSTYTTFFLRFNTTKPPFDNKQIRKAFAMALDKKRITERILRGGEIPTNVLIPPTKIGKLVYRNCRGLSKNVKLARQILEKFYPNPEKFPEVKFLITSSKGVRDMFQEIRNQWEDAFGNQIARKIVAYQKEWHTYLTAMSKLDYNISSGGWIGDYYDPNTFIDMFVTGGGNNRTGWGNPQYDRLVKMAASEPDLEKRFKIFQKCEKILVEEEAPIVPLYFAKEYILKKEFVKGFIKNPMDMLQLRYLYRE
jgi:oligopeptide transport system substrate-binding protein